MKKYKLLKITTVVLFAITIRGVSQDASMGTEQKKMTYDEWMNLYKKSLESELLRVRLQQQGAND